MGAVVAGAAVVGAAAAVSSGLFGAYQSLKAEEAAKKRAKLTLEMADYNAMVAEGQGRQALNNAKYDAEFADIQTVFDVFLMEYEQSQMQNEALYEANISKQIDLDAGINVVRKRKNDLLQLADAEAAAAGAGALVSGSVLEALSETAKNLELDALEINKMSKIESNDRLYRSQVLESEAGILGQKTKMRKTFGEMQSGEILRQGRLLQRDYQTEANRLRKYGSIDASSQMGAASQARTQAISTGINTVGQVANAYVSYKASQPSAPRTTATTSLN